MRLAPAPTVCDHVRLAAPSAVALLTFGESTVIAANDERGRHQAASATRSRSIGQRAGLMCRIRCRRASASETSPAHVMLAIFPLQYV